MRTWIFFYFSLAGMFLATSPRTSPSQAYLPLILAHLFWESKLVLASLRVGVNCPERCQQVLRDSSSVTLKWACVETASHRSLAFYLFISEGHPMYSRQTLNLTDLPLKVHLPPTC